MTLFHPPIGQELHWIITSVSVKQNAERTALFVVIGALFAILESRSLPETLRLYSSYGIPLQKSLHQSFLSSR